MKTPIKTLHLNPTTRIQAIETGRVAVRPSFKHKKGPSLISKLNIFLDKEFTEFMPVYVYVIEHPEGIIVIDTGENAHVKEPDYFEDAGWLGKAFNEKH
ncbi:MAG: N-acyl homoserine lactonase family protein, partial [Bacteroidetes bacterium]|nr:N-acyl homoserine lactonase family protein [Bacteroidota bacterium]